MFSPWFPRGGDNVILALEVIEISGASLKVELFTKNVEDAGSGANADTSKAFQVNTKGPPSTLAWISTTYGAPPPTAATIKELVRYKFMVSGESVANWVLFRMLSPIWFDMVRGQ